MAKGRITKRAIDALRPGDRTEFLWDDQVPGFGLRVTPAGKESAGVKSFVFQYGSRDRRRITIGRFGEMTVDAARKAALKLRARVAEGADPTEERASERRAPTVAEFAERALREHWRKPKNCKPRTAVEVEKLLERWILPALGRKRIAQVTRKDVKALHDSMDECPISANRMLACVSKLWGLAAERDLVDGSKNPARDIKRNADEPRKRYLSEEEIERLSEVLRRADDEDAALLRPAPHATNAIRLLLLTGCRLNEVLGLEWSQVDLERRRINFPDSKSKTGWKWLPLTLPALALLDRLPRFDGNPFVFPSVRRAGGHLTELRPSWSRIRRAAGLDGKAAGLDAEAAKLFTVRLHDLRHSYAAMGVSVGASLVVVGRMLGHKRASTATPMYAHVLDSVLHDAAELTAGRMAALLEPRATPAAEVVEEVVDVAEVAERGR